MELQAKEREALVSRTQGKDALNHAIVAAELYMSAASQASVPSEKTRLKQKCMQLIAKAETLKKESPVEDAVAAVERRLKLPRRVREIPTSEKNILLRGSRLHGNIFPPWSTDPKPEEFGGAAFIDAARFPLSERQSEVFAGWKRPPELAGVESEMDTAQARRLFMETDGDFDLVQDITTDCSVVASLCASIPHLKSGPMSMLPALMFPSSPDGQPELSQNGKYIFRMYFNGCFRKVVVDDRLPSSSNERALYVVDRQNRALIWPALMEKAYLKVRGGYDFPGSNSGTDLWVLTGWIPQQIFLQSDDVDFDQTWKRVKKAYDFGDVVVTLGTGRLSIDEEEALGLAGEHDYAVLDISEASGSKMMLVKNPWCEGLVWKGLGSSAVPSAGGTGGNESSEILKPGTFWISFDDVAQNFESLYLNWTPSLFTERQDHHFTWTEPEANMIHSFARHPQYSMTAQADGSTWILLSRHFQDAELDIARRRYNTLAATSNKLGFMSLYIFDNNGKRVQLPDKSIYRGPFVDSPQTLAPFEAKKGVKYTIVVASQDLPLPNYAFTLSFFSRCPLVIEPAAHGLRHYTEQQSAWTRRTAGGNPASSTYVNNPQFSISVPQAGPISLLLSTARTDIPVHIDVVWASGRRVTAVTVRDLVATSGDYRRGGAQVRVPSVDAGTYTVVCSTFEPGQLADFTLRVGSNVPCSVTPVPSDAAGLLRTQLPDLVFGGSGGGGSGNKKRARVSVSRLIRATVVVHPVSFLPFLPDHAASGANPAAVVSQQPRRHPSVRVCLEHGRGPNKVTLASTGEDGEFGEVGLGLRTSEFDLDPVVARPPPLGGGGVGSSDAATFSGLWLVAERMAGTSSPPGSEGTSLRVEVLSDGHVALGPWETIDD